VALAPPRHPALIFGGLALAIVAAGGWFDHLQHRALLAEAERKVDAIARLEARSIRDWRWSLQRCASAAAASWESLAGQPQQEPLLRASLAGYRDRFLFTDVAVVGPRGEVEVAAGAWAGGVPRGPLERPLPETWIGGTEPLGERHVFHIFAPLGAGRVAVFRADLEGGVEPLLDSWPSASQGTSKLVRRTGEELIVPERAEPGPVLRAWASVERSDWAVVAEEPRAAVEGSGSTRRVVLSLLVVALVAAAALAVQARSRRERLAVLERSWRAERRARLLRDEQARLVEVVDDPMLVLDVDRRVRFWNAAAARLYGHPADEAIGRSADALVGAPLLGAEAAWDGLRDGRTVRLDVEHRRRDGAPVQVELTAVVLRDPDQVVTGYLAVCRDRTERLRDEAARRGIEAQLAQADRMASMGLIAAGVAHEMATPLAYVLTSLRYAREELAHPAPSLEELRAALQDAEEGGERVRRILSEVRTFSRSGGDGEGPADVARVVESALRLAAAELRNRARTATDVPPVLRVVMGADRLGQLVLNLVMNAAQAISPGAPDGNAVRVAARREGDEVVLEVSDTGAGIPPEVAARIFEPFYTTKPAGVGTGLGLSICRRLVEEARGTLSFETAPGRCSASGSRRRPPRPRCSGRGSSWSAPRSAPRGRWPMPWRASWRCTSRPIRSGRWRGSGAASRSRRSSATPRSPA